MSSNYTLMVLYETILFVLFSRNNNSRMMTLISLVCSTPVIYCATAIYSVMILYGGIFPTISIPLCIFFRHVILTIIL